ncbi:MAG: iron ABC transporter permease [Pseudomonadales bacterium]|nr:iron ABC transporter permease [Pseudomonadales bacterium]
MKTISRPVVIWAALLTVGVGLVIVSLLLGRGGHWLSYSTGDVQQREVSKIILMQIRLPRTLLALLVGASLGMAGAALQGLLRNPLADPGVIGVSSGAAFGAVLAFYFGLSQTLALALPLAGMLGAGLALGLLFLLAGRGASTLGLVLAGVAVSAFAAALTSLALNLAPSPFAALEIIFWMMGSLVDRSMQHVWLAVLPIATGLVLLLTQVRALDALTLGEDVAATLGYRSAVVRTTVLIGCAAAVGASVSVSGSIGFVGLVVPHLLRPFVGHEPGRLLPLSAVGGAVMLLAADLLTRLPDTGPELRLGVVTALLGAPFFLLLLMRLRREVM